MKLFGQEVFFRESNAAYSIEDCGNRPIPCLASLAFDEGIVINTIIVVLFQVIALDSTRRGQELSTMEVQWGGETLSASSRRE